MIKPIAVGLSFALGLGIATAQPAPTPTPEKKKMPGTDEKAGESLENGGEQRP